MAKDTQGQIVPTDDKTTTVDDGGMTPDGKGGYITGQGVTPVVDETSTDETSTDEASGSPT